MNFYISNSNTEKNVIITFLFIVLFFIVMEFGLNSLISMKTGKNSYIMNIKSKTKHMKLNTGEDTQMIFIGNSRTVFHIDTEVFKKNNMQIYNYGVSDRSIFNYYHMTKNALRQEPDVIVLSLKISDIYIQDSYIDRVALSDIKAMIDTKQNFSLIKEAIAEYINKFYSLVDYGDVINIKIKSFYDRFTPKEELLSPTVISKTSNEIQIDKSACNIFDIKYPLDKIVVKCTNGDGILFGHKLSNENLSQNFKVKNKKHIDLLNYIVAEIKKHNVKPIIIFEPIYNAQYNYDFENIQEIIHSDIIDLTNMSISNVMWVDNNHLNEKGRVFYSTFLSEKLNEVINENSSF